jgi:DNA replication protein DnaC
MHQIANLRIHGEAKKRPVDLFAEERPHLKALPSLPADTSVVRTVRVGVGKSHLATALGYAACLRGKSVLFANAIDVINTLSAARNKGALKAELRKYLSPSILVLDEVGYLPIDQRGANLLFQVISQRYERGSIVLTTNKAFKQWPSIFNGDSTITSAVLDRLLHHAEIVLIEGTSFRMKDRIET